MKKNEKAITLIAFAGVLINISLGNNGLFNKAKTAKEMYTNAQNYEEEQIAKTSNEIDNFVEGSRLNNIEFELVDSYRSPINTGGSTAVDVNLKKGKYLLITNESFSEGFLGTMSVTIDNATIEKNLSNYHLTWGETSLNSDTKIFNVESDKKITINITSDLARGYPMYAYDLYRLK